MLSMRSAVLLPLLVLPGIAHGYSGTADVTLAWGAGGTSLGWSGSTQNALDVLTDATRLTTLDGSNQTTYFNADFASSSDYAAGTGDDCLTQRPGYDTIVLRKYGCRQLDSTGNLVPVFHGSSAVDEGPAAAAVGTLNFTDDTLTGTLTVVATTDEPTGGNESSAGNGASGFNLRVQDGSAYGNAWYGVSAGATLTVDLTGNFSAAGWEITGGTVRVTDPGFQCQQGGIGGVAPQFVLCQVSAVPGGLAADGSNLSFGLDADGGGAGTSMTPVLVRDSAGTVVASLGGVLASLTVTAGGVLTTEFGEYRSGTGTGSGGCLGQIRWDGSKITCGTLTAGSLEISGTATPVDTDPEPFAFDSVLDADLSVVLVSGAATITGIAAPARITVTGGQYSIGCTGTFTSAAGNVSQGSTVCVRHTSAAVPATDTVTTLTVGSITGTFTSTTGAAPPDTTPDAFVFVDQMDVALSTDITSAEVTISGIDSPATVTVAGGSYSVGCSGTFVSAPGTVANGQAICVRHTSSASNASTVSTTLTVDTVSDTFSSTTVAAGPPDTTPDAFSFAAQSNVALSTAVASAPAIITGITAPAAVSVTGGAWSAGCNGTFVSTQGSITAGQAVCVRHTSAAANGTVTSTTLTVGGISAVFSSTTVGATPPDTTPNAFVFTDQSGVALSTPVTSAAVTITGIDAAAPISVSGGEYSVGCGASFGAAPGSILAGQSVCVRHSSAAANSTVTSTTLTVGGVSDVFTSTTLASSGGSGGGGGGGAVDGGLLGLLVGVSALRRRALSRGARAGR